MENRVGRLIRSPKENQPTPLPEELQIIKHITRLTLLLGIMIGITLVFLAMVLYNTFFAPRGGPSLFAPIALELLLPLILISSGAAFVTQWRLQILRCQSTVFRNNIDTTFSWQLGILGISFIGAGCLILLIRRTSLPASIGLQAIGIWFIGFLAAYLYLLFHNRLRKIRY